MPQPTTIIRRTTQFARRTPTGPIVEITVEDRQHAYHSATDVACRHCGQPKGSACVTTGLNEAAFPHAKRLADRLAQIMA